MHCYTFTFLTTPPVTAHALHVGAKMHISIKRRNDVPRARLVAALCCTILAASAAQKTYGQPPPSTRKAPRTVGVFSASPLRQLDADLKALTAKVSPAVVQVLVTGYGPVGGGNPSQAAVLVRQQGVGSGVILDPSGYIITNAHVVKGAERVQVIFARSEEDRVAPLPAAPEQSMLPATIVGFTDYFDLALLKVDATDLPTLPFADFRTVTQGQVVLAIGSPLGLDNSVTMGVISSVARQANPQSPVVFVQTDAPINPGNSGGALVDVNGRLIGINTFILSQAGGNEGLGFALPAPIVRMAYESLRQKGHVDRRVIGVGIQRITPTLAQGLALPRAYGLLVCDVLSGSPGEEGGIKVGDVLVEADGRPISTPSQLDGSLYVHDLDRPMSLTVLRQGARLTLPVRVIEQSHQSDSLIDPTDPQKNLVRQLGVIAATVTSDIQSGLGSLRTPSGVVVVARTADPTGADLEPGDVVHSVNAVPITDVEMLRDQLDKRKRGDAVVLQVERRGGLEFAAFEMN
jgi:serine protease Do